MTFLQDFIDSEIGFSSIHCQSKSMPYEVQRTLNSSGHIFNASFDIRLRCGGIHSHMVYLKTWLIFITVYSSTYMTHSSYKIMYNIIVKCTCKYLCCLLVLYIHPEACLFANYSTYTCIMDLPLSSSSFLWQSAR